ncbi:MAG: phosphotransferase [Terricaulis sp.]
MQPDHTEIAERLRAYLRARSGDQDLAYAQPLVELTGGFDANIFSFSLHTADLSLSGPLVLRLFDLERPPALARKEAAVQNALAAMGYPAPHITIQESDSDVLGGAFLIMPRLGGQHLAAAFSRLSRERHSVSWVIGAMLEIMRECRDIWDDAQQRLHALDPDDFLARIEAAGLSRQNFSVDAELARFKAKIPSEYAAAFAPGFAWLEQNKPPVEERAICHGDLQPLNVLADGAELSGVLDWGATVVGHPAVDYGAVLAIMATAPTPGPWMTRPLIRLLMNKLARDHARPYFARHKGGRTALRYFAAYNNMSQLASAAAPRGTEGGAFRSAKGVRNLVACFRRYTNVRLNVQLHF